MRTFPKDWKPEKTQRSKEREPSKSAVGAPYSLASRTLQSLDFSRSLKPVGALETRMIVELEKQKDSVWFVLLLWIFCWEWLSLLAKRTVGC